MISARRKKTAILTLVLAVFFAFCSFAAVNAFKAKAEDSVAVTMVGASVRMNEENRGLRFEAKAGNSIFEGDALKDGYSAGVLVVDADSYKEDTALTKESAKDDGAYAGRVVDIEAVNFDFTKYVAANEVAFNGVITGIPENGYGFSLTARAYVYDGANYIYSNVITRSIAEVASMALVDEEDDDNKTVLNAYVDGVVKDTDMFDDTLTVKVGATSEKIAPKISYLTPVLSTASDALEIKDGKITALKPVADGTATVTATLGSKTENITVTVDDTDVKAELAGATRSSGSDLIKTGYTTDSAKLPSGSTVGLSVSAENLVSNGSKTVTYDTNLVLEAGVTYTLRYTVKKTTYIGSVDFGWLVHLGYGATGGQTSLRGSTALSGSDSTNGVYRREMTITPDEKIEGLKLRIVFGANAVTNVEFTVSDICLVKGLGSFASVGNGITYSEENAASGNVLKISGESLSSNTFVSIATGTKLTANTAYVLSFKFNIVKAKTSDSSKLHDRLYFFISDNPTAFKEASGLYSRADSDVAASCENKKIGITLEYTPAAVVEDFIFKVRIDSYVVDFEFEISDIEVIEKAGITKDLSGAAIKTYHTGALTDFISYFTADKTVLGDDYACGIGFEIKAHDQVCSGDGYVYYDLNVGMTAGKSYDISFTVIDTGIKGNVGGKWFLAFGLTGEKLANKDEQFTLQGFINAADYCTTTTKKIGDNTAYTLTFSNYVAQTTREKAQFRIYVPQDHTTYAQSCVVTGISITESQTAE